MNKLQSFEEQKNVADGLVNVTNNEDKLAATEASYKSLHNKKDPLIQLSIEKIRPLVDGLNLYKRYNNISITKLKQFDPAVPGQNTPELCGYSMRNFKINPSEEMIEIKNMKTKIIEQKLAVGFLKSVMLSNSAKQIIKNKKSLTKKPNSEIEKLVQSEFIVFTVLFTDGSMDLIAPNFAVFSTFQTSIEELMKQKKNIFSYLKFN